MLLNVVKNLFRQRSAPPGHAVRTASPPLRLHIGGKTRHPDWKIVDTVPGRHVDYVRSCKDLSIFPDASVAEIYASHVLEHLGYQAELAQALSEFHRVLQPGGILRASVPDLTTLCSLFLDLASNARERFEVMRMMFGGQIDTFDFHQVGLDQDFLAGFLASAGFTAIQRVTQFGLFDDSSRLIFSGRAISLNLVARKPGN
jgi:predicted SAM-dependent methyltransferase